MEAMVHMYITIYTPVLALYEGTVTLSLGVCEVCYFIRRFMTCMLGAVLKATIYTRNDFTNL